MTPPAENSATALLHHGGPPSGWANLGLWPLADQADAAQVHYAEANAALARRVAQAAGLAGGERVLELACGAGDGLLLWLQEFGAGSAHGIELDPAAARGAQERTGARMPAQTYAQMTAPTHARTPDAWLTERIELTPGPALAVLPRLTAASFDAVLCVDAAYHLGPRAELLAAIHHALRPGARLAFTDLVVDRRRHVGAGAGALLLHGAARLCGVAAADLVDAAAACDRVAAAGFCEVRLERLDEPVLGGFVRFVREQRLRLGPLARGAGWRRVAITAALIPPRRAAGLGYALISARKPLAASASPRLR